MTFETVNWDSIVLNFENDSSASGSIVNTLNEYNA